MNIVQLHYKIKFYLDSEMSPRWRKGAVDKAINSAIYDIILRRVERARNDQKDAKWQQTQMLRDELYTLVKKKTGMDASGDIIPVSKFPDDYMMCLILEANVSGTVISTIPLTYDEYAVINLDPFRRPSISFPERIYRIESSEGHKVVFGDIGTLISGDMYYIAEPQRVSIGTEVSTVGASFTNGQKIIAYTDAVITEVFGSYTENVNVESEVEYTIQGNSATLNSGVVFKNYTGTDLPDSLHEELCRKAAAILSGNVADYNKSVNLEEDIDKK